MLYLFAYDKSGDAETYIASIRFNTMQGIRPIFLYRMFPSLKSALIYRDGCKEEEWVFRSTTAVRRVYFCGAVASVEYDLCAGQAISRSWEYLDPAECAYNKGFAKELGDQIAVMRLTTSEDVHEQIKVLTSLNTTNLEELPLELKYVFLRALGKMTHREAMKQIGVGKIRPPAPESVPIEPFCSADPSEALQEVFFNPDGEPAVVSSL